jgi:hypothetical protein
MAKRDAGDSKEIPPILAIIFKYRSHVEERELARKEQEVKAESDRKEQIIILKNKERINRRWAIIRQFFFFLIFTSVAYYLIAPIASEWIRSLTQIGNARGFSAVLATAGKDPLSCRVGVYTAIFSHLVLMAYGLRFFLSAVNEPDSFFDFIFAVVGGVFFTVMFWGAMRDDTSVISIICVLLLPWWNASRCLLSYGGRAVFWVYAMAVPSWMLGWSAGALFSRYFS